MWHRVMGFAAARFWNAVDFVYVLLCAQSALLSLMRLYQANTPGPLVCGVGLSRKDRVYFAEHRQQLLKNQVAG